MGNDLISVDKMLSTESKGEYIDTCLQWANLKYKIWQHNLYQVL